jgi:hypothetical protein
MLSANPPLNFWAPETIFMKLDIYVKSPEPVSTAVFSLLNARVHIANKMGFQKKNVYVTLLSLLRKGSVNCIPSIVARQRLGKHVFAAMNTQ